jgi:hypothetical protein
VISCFQAFAFKCKSYRYIERRAAAVRDAYCAGVSQSHVPASYLEVAALAAHLRRPITVIRGPVGLGVDAGVEPTSGERRWRARCATEVVGAAHGRRGRAGRGWHFSPRYFAVKTHSIDDSQCGPCNESSDTPRE